ncbi:MAG: hypothetical protein ACFB15_14000, partial [Cyclobacteriaceae bacterium]
MFAQSQNTDSPFLPCQEIELVTDTVGSVKRKLLSSFLDQAFSDGYFINDKGIVHVYRYRNSEGDSVWLLEPSIDDRYQDNPPTKFADYRGDIFLVWEADKNGSPEKNPDPDVYNQCLEQVIGDRVYLRPEITTRWTSDTTLSGLPRPKGNSRIATGGGGALKYVFSD